MMPAPSDERATSPLAGVVLLFVVAVLVAGAVGVGVFGNDDTVTAGVQIAAIDGEATVLWTEAGNARYIEVTTGNSLGNATIESVNGTVELPRDVGRAGDTNLVVRAVNNESERIIEEQEVELE
jgi:FlaG/FlaF family flagellin (archaellin)